MTDHHAIRRVAAHLQGRCAAHDLDAVTSGIETLRALDPDHPDIDLATALLWEAQGKTVEAVAARIRGYERTAARTGDPIARSLLKNILSQALNAGDGHAMLRPAALTSSDPAVLETFLTVSCNQGYFDDGAVAIGKLRELNGGRYRDAEDVVILGQNIDTLVLFAPETVVVLRPAARDRGTLHHSVVAQAVIGAAERRDRLTESFARPLAEALAAYGVYTEAAALGALRHLLVLGRDACAATFLDLSADRLSVGAQIEILDHAMASAVRRDAIEAARSYGRRFGRATRCGMASLSRLSSHVGVRAHRRPIWAACLQSLSREQAVADAPTAPPACPFPSEPPVYRSDDRIDVFLKCVKRPFDIHPFVSFWMECFHDPSRYRVRLLDDTGLDLAEYYKQYPIEDSRSLREGTNEAHALFARARRPLNLLGWESAANLTPFALTEARRFWNIDADDIRPLLDARTTMADVRCKLRAVEDFAADSDLMAISYDLWASTHYLFDHGYHWTFGICLCRSDPALLGQMLTSLTGCDVPVFRINLDHLLSRLSDGCLGEGRYSRYFSSFVFDRMRVIQKDIKGNDIYHKHEHFKKYLAFDPNMVGHVRNDLHPKTLVV